MYKETELDMETCAISNAAENFGNSRKLSPAFITPPALTA